MMQHSNGSLSPRIATRLAQLSVPVMLSVCAVCNRTRDWFAAISE